MKIEKTNFNVSDFIKNVFRQEVSKKIDEEIDKKVEEFRKEVEEFRKELVNNKDNYIAEIMKAIRIYSEQQSTGYYPRYQIVFENVYKEEKWKK